MVFESVLVQVLNRFLGAYVENLDPSQLKANVWSGDVKLGGLKLKQNALDKLDLPFRIFAGYLNKFSMKVPWSNLYTDPVIAEIDGVYIVAGPASAVRYDADTDLREQREAKEKQLKHVDETKKKTEVEEDKPEEAPGFVEKLVTQIVKNLRVKVRNIHIQYEDSMSNHSSPFSFGVSLDSLFMENTDSAYDSEGTSVDPDTSLIYKLLQLNCLSIYWNSNIQGFGSHLPDNWKDILHQSIARENLTPDLQYVVKPITASARVRLCTKPGQDMHIPQALVKLVLQEVALTLSKQQYQDLVNFVESLDRLSISQRFRRYRPLKPPGEDKRAWWRYAFDAESVDIKRRMEAWSWSHIKAHRSTCREYTKAYQEKLLSKSLSPELVNQIQGLEDQLDVLNITICRQLAENEAQRKLQERKKVESERPGWWAWATGWATAAPTAKDSPKEPAGLSDGDIAREKEKLYQAIGYAKDSKLPDYPKEYVAHNLIFELKKVSIQLQNENGNIAQFVTKEIAADLKHRPTSKNISVITVVKTVHMSGLLKKAEVEAPTIVQVQEENGSLMHVEFEMNPLKSQVNYRVAASLSPILVFYDAATVDAMIGMFLLPKDVQLQSISAAAASALEGIKTQSRAGLEHIIGERTFFEVDVSLKSPCLLIPEGGAMKSSATVVVVDLGSLRVTTDLTSKVIPDVRTATLEELQEASYDSFNLQISNVQLVMTGPGEDWKEALHPHDSTHHLLKPSGLDLVVKKSILPMDTRLPSLVVGGTLPLIALSLSDRKAKQLMKLFQSLPLPPPSLASRPSVPIIPSKAASVYPTINTAAVISMVARNPPDAEQECSEDDPEFETASEGEEEREESHQVKKGSMQTDSETRMAEASKEDVASVSVVASATTMTLRFAINGIVVDYSEYVDEKDIERLKFLLSEVQTEVVMRSWDLSVAASVGSAEIQDHFTKGTEPHLLLSSGSNVTKFLNVKYFKNDRASPHYGSSPQPTEHTVVADMSVVKVQIRKGSLVKLMSMGLSVISEIKSNDQSSKSTVAKNSVTPAKDEGGSKKSVRSQSLPGEREVYVEARFGGLEVIVGDEHGDILMADMTGLSTTVTVLEEYTAVTANMNDIMVMDKEPMSCYPKVVCKMDDSATVISAQVKVLKNIEKTNVDISSADMCVSAAVQRLTVFVVFKFVNRVMLYVDEVMEEVRLAKKANGLPKETSLPKALEISGTQEKLTNGSKIGLSVSISAPLVVLPLTSTSSSAFVADLGHMEVTNTFHPAEKVAVGQHPPEKFVSSGGIPAIVDDMTVDITSVQLFKINNAMILKTEDFSHAIIVPVQFHGHVIRKLSGWCTVVPDISIDAELPSLEVRLGPGDYSAILSLMNSLGDGRPTTPPSDKGEDDGREKGEDLLESKQMAIPLGSEDAASSDCVKLLMKLQMKKVVLHLNEQSDGGNVERLKFLLSEMETKLVMRSWDLSVTASIGRAEIQDHFAEGVEGKPHILLSSGSSERKVLNAVYCKMDVQSQHYCSSPHPTEQSVIADMSVVKVQILKGSLVKLMSMGLSIMAEIKSVAQLSKASVTKEVTSQNGNRKKSVRQHLPGEREMYIEARFGGLEVIVGDEHGDILSADMTDLSSTVTVVEEWTSVTASMKNIMIMDKDTNSYYSKVVSKLDDSAAVVSAQIKVFKKIEKTSVDISSADMCVSATVQRLAVFVVFKFVNRVMEYLNEVTEKLRLAKKKLGLSEGKALSEVAEVQSAQEETNGSKIGLSVSISAPLVVLPLTSTSSSAFVADLGHMEVINTFLRAEKVAVGQHPPEMFLSSGGIPAIVDDMTVDITSVQLFKVKDVTKLKDEVDTDHAIIMPIKFHGHVIRKLSDWCSVVPDISIDAELPSLEVQLGPGDYSAMLSLMNSLGDGRPTTPPSNKGEGDGGGEKEEKEEEGSKSKELELSLGTKGVAPRTGSCVKLLMKFQMKKVILYLNEQSNGGNIERLKFFLSEMETELVMRSWDLSVTALVGSAEIQDHFSKDIENTPHILLHAGSEEGKFLTTKYCKNDRQSPDYGSSPHPTEQSVIADMSVVKVQILKGSLVKLVSMGLSIMSEIKSSNEPSSTTKKVNLPTEEGETKKVVRQHLPDERELYIEARFGGLEVTLGDEHGDILSADLMGLSTAITVLEKWTLVTASMKNITVIDKDPYGCHSKVVSKMDNSSTVISTEIKVFKKIEKTSVDISSADMCVSATVQRLTVFIVFKFVNRVMHYMDELVEELKLAKKTLGVSEERALEIPGAQEEKNGSKIGLLISVSAPLVVLPLTSTSSSAFVADLGHMEVTNTFLPAEKVAVGQHPPEKFVSSGGIPAIVDDMTVDITSVQLFKIDNAMILKTEDFSHSIIMPVQFHGHVIHKLSDWCSVVPDISIDAELPSLEVQLGPGDYSAILSFMNTLGDGRPTTPPSDKGEDDGGEKGEDLLESKQMAIPLGSEDAASSDCVKLLMKFQMKEVVLHLNEQSDGGNVERLKFLLSEMETKLVMRSWDLSVTAYIGSAEIQDHFAEGVEGKPHILLSSGSSERKVLNAVYCKMDVQSQHYCSSPHPTEQSVIADMSVVKVQILKGSLVKLMSMGLSIMDEIKSVAQLSKASVTKEVTSQNGNRKKSVRQHLPGEREMYIEARFGGLEVIVGDEHGDILSADMTDLSSTVTVVEEWTLVTASMKNIMIMDKDANSYHSKVVSKLDDSAAVLSAQIKVFKKIEKTNVNISTADMCVSATVQRLTVFIVFKFVNRVMDYLNEVTENIKLAKKKLGLSEGKALSEVAEVQSAQEETNGSKIGLSVSISAPLVVLPLTSTSSSAFVADLGHMEVSNTFLPAEKVAVGQHPPEKFLSSGGIPAIVDNMTVDITSVQLFKVKDVTKLKDEVDTDHAIIMPIQFHSHVIRKLSDWCSVVPDISIDAELPSLEVQLGPGDYSAILSLMNALGDSRPTIPPSNKGEGKGEGDCGGEKEEKEEEGSRSEELELSLGTKGVTPSTGSCVKLLMTFQMKKVILYLNEQSNGGNIERLKFFLSEMETEVVMRSWDLSVTASVGSAEIQDQFTKVVDIEKTPHILLHAGSEEGKFLTTKYCKNDPQSPDYASSPHPTEQSVIADMSVVKVQILKGSLVKLMSMGLSIMSEIKSSNEPSSTTKKVNLPTEEGETKKVVRQHFPGEREVYIEARFGGLEVTLGDEHGDVLSADMMGLSTAITVLEKWTLVTASMKNITVIDKDPYGCHSKVVSKMDNSSTVISTEIKVFKKIEKTSVDISSADMCVSATVQRLTVFIVFKFVNRVMEYLSEVTEKLKLAKKKLGLSEGKALSEVAEVQSAQEETNGSKIGLSVSISAPLVVLPLTSTSSSAFVADLGHMEVTNTFLPAEKVAVGQHPSEKFVSSGGIPAIVDDMTVDITSLRMFKVKDVTKLKDEVDTDHAIIMPIKFHGHVIRKLSDWCSVVPDISIDAELPSLEVQLGPGDYSAILSLVNSLGDGRPTTPPSDKGEDKGGSGDDGEKQEKEEEGSKSKELELSLGTKGVTPSTGSCVKLLMTFQMKKVILYLNELSNGGNIERLKFFLSEMETEVVMRSWDLSVTASVGSAEIQDQFTKVVDIEKTPHILLQAGSEGGKFLTTKYCKNDSQSPDYASSPHPTEQSVIADMSVVKVQILKGSLVKLMSMGLTIMAEIKSSNEPSSTTKKVNLPTEERETKKVVRQHLPGEREMYIEARFGGLEVTLGDEHGDILSADLMGLSTAITVLEKWTVVTASMKNIAVIDKDPYGCHSNVVSKMDNSSTVISTEIKVFKKIEKTSVDISSADMCVSATVQRLAVFIVFKFVNRVMHYMDELVEELKLAKKTLGVSEERALEIPSTQEETNGSKIGLSISISAPLVVLPLTSTSSSAFVADLGHMEVTNTFLPSEKVAVGQHPPEKFVSSGGIPAIVDDMTVDITSVQLFKLKDTATLKTQDGSCMIIKPIEFHGHVIRKLSDWCSVVPDIGIDAELPSLEVQLGPGDYSAILSLMNSLNDGRPTTPPSDKREDDGGEKGEAEKLLESKELPSDTKGARSNSYVKLSTHLKVKEVVLHLNELSDGGNVERLKFLLSEMETELVMRSWDLNVTASVGYVEIHDHFNKGAEGKSPILLSSGSNERKFLNAAYCKNDPQSPHYGSSPHPTEQSVIADMSVVKVQILKGSLVKLMSMGLSIMNEIKSDDQHQSATKNAITLPSAEGGTKKVVRCYLPDEREMYIEARFGGLAVTLGDEHGDILSADVSDLSSTVSVLEKSTVVTASMKDIMVTDKNPINIHPVVVTKMDNSATVISTKIVIFKNVERTDMDISDADMFVSATVQRLTVFVVFKFVNRVMDYLNEVTEELKVTKNTLGRLEEKTSLNATEVQSAEKNGSKIGLSVSISAPLVVLPLTSTSSSAFVADLGHMEVTNTFLPAEKVAVGQHPPEKFLSSGGIPAIVDDMTVDITSVQLFKAKDLKIEELNHMIIAPIQFHGHVIRKLSDWCSVVPDISIDAELPSLEVQLGPGDYSAILSLMNSLGDGKPTTPPSDKGEDDNVGDKGVKKELLESKERVITLDHKDATFSSVKLLINFQMKKVVLHLSEQGDGGNIEKLKFLLSEMETELVMRSWDLNVTASIGSAEIQDFFTKGVDSKPHPLLSSGSEKERFLKAKYCKNDRCAPHFGTASQPVEQSISATVSMVNIWLQVESCECLFNILKSITAEFSSKGQESQGMVTLATTTTSPVKEVETAVAIGAGVRYVVFHFTAALDQVEVKIYEAIKDTQTSKREPSNLLASLAVVGLKASGSTYNNGLMEAELCMDNFTLDDDRLGTTGIRHAIRKTPLEDGGSKAMAHLTYMSSIQKEQSVVIEVDGAQVLVNLPFILKLVDFAMAALKPLTVSVAKDDNDEILVAAISGTEVAPAQNQRQMKVSVLLTRPCIALIESPGIPDPNVLVLEMVVSVDVELKTEQWNLGATVESLHVASTKYMSLGNTKTYAHVLAPTRMITVSLNSTGIHCITVPLLFLTVSPATIRLVLNVVKSLQQEQHAEDELPPSAPPDLFSVKEVDKTRWYFASNSEVNRVAQFARLVSQTSNPAKQEMLKIAVSEVTIVVEKEESVGPNIPVIVLLLGKYKVEALNLTAKDWSTHLSLEANTSLQVKYFNSPHGVWEPLVEPLIDPSTDNICADWSLGAKVSMSENAKQLNTGRRQSLDLVPDVSIEVTSRDVLNITLTQTCISLINDLAHTYMEGDKRDQVDYPPESYDAVYYLINDLGRNYPVSVKPGGTLKVHGGYSNTLYYGVHVELRALPLILADPESDMGKPAVEGLTRKVHILQLEISGFKTRSIILGGSDKVYYALQQSNNSTVQYGMVVEVQQQSAGKGPQVTLRSPLQIKNHLSVDVELYWSSSASLDSQYIVSVTKDGGIANIPLKQAHEGSFTVKPCIIGAGHCSPSVSYLMEGNEISTTAHSQAVFVLVSKEEEVYSRKNLYSLEERPHHTLHLSSPFVVRNLLPVPLILEDVGTLQPGSKVPINTFSCGTTMLKLPLKFKLEEVMWIGEINVSINEPKDSSIVVSCAEKYLMKLAVHKEQKNGWKLTLYSPYWIVNKTGQTLEYECMKSGLDRKYHNVIHPPKKQALLFSHKETRVRVNNTSQCSEWSKSFSLDTVGHGGVFTCKVGDGPLQYQFGTTIQASGSGFTKIVTILPFYLVQNRTRETIIFGENNGDTMNLISLKSKEMVPFWPKGSSTQMVVKAERDEQHNMSFSYVETSSFLLQTSPAIVVDVQVTDASTIITFSPYFLGAAPIQLVNTTSFEIAIKQDTNEAVGHVLPPSQTMLYTWEDPCGKKELVWNVVGMTPFSNRVEPKDGSGKFSIPSMASGSSVDTIRNSGMSTRSSTSGDEAPISEDSTTDDEHSMGMMGKQKKHGTMWKRLGSHIHAPKPKDMRSKRNAGYWTCFMDGLQRLLVFSMTDSIKSRVFDTQSVECPQLDLSLSLSTVILSLVNDKVGWEVATVGITQSDVVWEVEKKKNLWKAVPLELKNELEELHNLNRKTVEPLKCRNYTSYKVNFIGEEPYLIDDMAKRMKLRRSHFDGFFFQWTTTAQFDTIHVWVNNLQVDNHISHAKNPIIFHSWPQPEAIISRCAPKPFLEGTLALKKKQQGNGLSVEMLQVLVQEFGLKVDIRFIMSLTTLLEAFSVKTPASELIAAESKMAETPLGQGDIAQASTTFTRHYFKFLHLSPLLAHLTLELEMPKDAKVLNVPILGTIVHVLGSFAGVIGKTKDAEMRLGYYQLENALLTQQALKDRVLKHYIQQGLVHFYSVVLGLDVLGNPAGFIRGLAGGTKGIFYHPLEGAVLGPGEFLEGLSLGGRQFIGGTVGGLSGVAGQVLGVGGDLIAKLTFDKEHQEERRQGDGSIEHAIGGVARGVFHGLTGLVTNPVKDVQKDGAIGLLTGAGKGLAGLIAKPTGAIVDLTSATLTTIQKKTQVGDVEIVQTRPTRVIGPDKVVYPYSLHKAEGYAAFKKYCLITRKSDVVQTDTFLDYLVLDAKPLRCLIVTSLRFIVTEVKVLGGMEELEMKFKNLVEPVTLMSDVIKLVHFHRHHSLFMATHNKSEQQERSIQCPTRELALKAANIINQAYAEYIACK